ncbi:hypothetical protein M433DRAFT_10422 [Acidomyces richmondensis BFW]|nr:hypothetical protein M433DRAFT_10422 [Acidomyces richmondensis BFW]
MTYNYEVFTDYTDHKGTVTIADGTTLEARGNGTIKIEVNGRPTIITDVVYVPKLGYNLISIPQLTDRDITAVFTRKNAILSRKGESPMFYEFPH